MLFVKNDQLNMHDKLHFFQTIERIISVNFRTRLILYSTIFFASYHNAQAMNKQDALQQKDIKIFGWLTEALEYGLKKHHKTVIRSFSNLFDDSTIYKKTCDEIEESFRSTADNPQKPYVLLCYSCQHPDQNIFACTIFDIKKQQWLQGQKIQLKTENNTFETTDEWITGTNGSSYIKYNFNILDSQLVVIHINDTTMPLGVYSCLAQAFESKNIPVVFSIREKSEQVIFSEFDEDNLPKARNQLYQTLTQKSLENYQIVDTMYAESERKKAIHQKTIEKIDSEEKDNSNHFFTLQNTIFGGVIFALVIILCWNRFYRS